MNDDDRYITRVWYQDGVEYTSRYDKQTGLIFTTEVSQPRISLREIQRDLNISDDDFDRMFPEPLQSYRQLSVTIDKSEENNS